MSPAAWKGHLPHGVEEKTTPDGRTFWVDHRPGKPTWEDPRSHSSDPLPPGVEQHITPDGVPFFINRNPRVTWSDPRTSARPAQAPARKDSSAHFTEKAGKDIYEDEKEDLVLPQACPMPAVADAEHVLLMRMTRWRMSQVLSGYPDGRTDDVDTIISLLSTRLNIPGASTMDTMDESCIDLCYNLISSEPTLDYSMIPPRGRKISRGKNVPGPHGIWAIICPWIYLFLLGIPRNYQWRLSKADWVQWASSKRWVEQRDTFSAFMNSLVGEWNLINLISTLFFSATVSFLSINNLTTLPAAATLISMILTMGSLIMSVSLMWRYQRQLGQVSGLRAVMDEFIYSPDTEVLTILLSLPLAFLIWSVIAFAVAVVSYSFSFTPYWECSIGTLIALVLVIFASTVSWFVHIHLSNTIYVCKRAWRGLRGAGWSLLSGKETESEMSMGGSFGQA